ncbi:hypothetical protein D3C86_2145880 [compost metagenome]
MLRRLSTAWPTRQLSVTLLKLGSASPMSMDSMATTTISSMMVKPRARRPIDVESMGDGGADNLDTC